MIFGVRPAALRGFLGRISPYTAALMLCLLVFPGVLPAQTETASVSGTIVDRSGGLVPGVQVIVINTDTNEKYESKTNSAGVYNVPSVKPGHYRILVSKQGFKEIDLRDVTLNVQDSVNHNFTLEIGGTSEVVIVSGNDIHINTTDATVSTVVDRQFAENLPMNGRSFQTLIQLTPGVIVTPSNIYDSGQFSVNGQRATSNYWTVDGVSANTGVSSGSVVGNGFGGTLGSFSTLGGTNSLVSVDALQEFRIQTSTYAPEFGRTPGAQISIATRSGTNQWHGTGFDYLRNDVLDANDWFANYASLPKPEERQNDFGGTLSGPIFKDRTFFFFSYEGLRLRLPQTTLTTVPDLVARQGASSAVQPYLNAYPIPNGPDDPATGIAQFNASYRNAASLDAYSLRIDHKLSDKLSVFGRYNYSPSDLIVRGGSGVALSTVTSSAITIQTATVGTSWAISPSIVNDFRFNYSRTSGTSQSNLDNFGGAVPLTSLPLPSPITADSGNFFLFVLSLTSGNALSAGNAAHNLQRQINLVDSLSFQRGSHSLKFGIDLRRLTPQFNPPVYGQSAIFNDVPSFAEGSALLGLARSFPHVTELFRNLGMFAQDTWRITPRLTLTYGLRWDVDFAPSSLKGPSIPAVTGYDLNDFSHLAVAPAGTSPFRTRYDNVAPRIGLAYQLGSSQNWQTVLRGGAGIFFDLASSEAGLAISFARAPFAASNFFFSASFPFDSAQIAVPPLSPTTRISDLYAFNPNLRLPYTSEWNLALEQSLGGNQTVSVTYLGAVGRRLLQTSVIVAPPTNPNVNGDFVDNTATSDYEALQVQFQRRLSHGLQALASYTWSHSIDTASAGSPFGSPANSGGMGNGNRGPSDFDIRHAFSAGLTYDIPAPKVNAWTSAILRGWSIENILQAHSAPPVDISDVNFTQLNTGFQADIRPDIVPGQPLYVFGAKCASVLQASGAVAVGQGCPGGKGFNPAAFANPPTDPTTGNPLRPGDLPRNALRGFGAFQWDLAVHRDFPIYESLKLQFRAEMFNILNHPNFGPPLGTFGAGGFGVSSQTLGQSLNSGFGGNLGGGAFSPLYQIGGPRSVQLALKLQF
ncbi:MAG TPA: TonB-dependent receptor [Candidatus Acidoferrum sp.]|nr:TonB-dependent receptor [Candidatus Acidoferrum sp.]